MKSTLQRFSSALIFSLVFGSLVACAQQDAPPVNVSDSQPKADLSVQDKSTSELMSTISTPKTQADFLKNLHFIYIHHLSDDKSFFTEDNLKKFFGGEQVWYKGFDSEDRRMPCSPSPESEIINKCSFKDVDEVEISYQRGRLKDIFIYIYLKENEGNRDDIRTRQRGNRISVMFHRKDDLDQASIKKALQNIFGSSTNQCPRENNDYYLLKFCYSNTYQNLHNGVLMAFDKENKKLIRISIYSSETFFSMHLIGMALVKPL